MTSEHHEGVIEALRRELEQEKQEHASTKGEVAELKRENAELKRNLDNLKQQALVDYTTPRYLTEGSFGKISYLPLQTHVYKTTILGDKANGKKLKHEFQIYQESFETIESARNCIDSVSLPDNSIFISPCPRQCYDPFNGTIKASYRTGTSYLPSWEVFDHATMSLDLIPSIPPLVALAYKSEFFTSDLARTSPTPDIRLLRLYLGRELPMHIHELQPGLRSDLALDAERYQRLSDALQLEDIASLPNLHHVASGMGVILAQLHFSVGIDAMDVELVIAGDGNHGLQCHILDYNQCQRWLNPRPLDRLGSGKLTINGEDPSQGAIRLARRIGNCEHYYPKPSQDLYSDFRQAYGDTVSSLVEGKLRDVRGRSGEIDAAFEQDVEALLAAGDAFLAEYEKVGRETAERKDRTEGRRKEASSVL